MKNWTTLFNICIVIALLITILLVCSTKKQKTEASDPHSWRVTLLSETGESLRTYHTKEELFYNYFPDSITIAIEGGSVVWYGAYEKVRE